MKAQLICPSCHKVANVTLGDISEYHDTKDNQDIIVTYFKCPNCGTKVCVQIDNTETKELLKKLQLSISIAQYHQRAKGNKKHKAETIRLSELDSELEDKRTEFIARYGSLYQFQEVKTKLD